MNATRQKLVDRAFALMDKHKSGTIDINDLYGVYDASRHPDVLNGKRREREILTEFFETFEQAHCVHNKQKTDSAVTKAEFNEYYTNVSSSVDSDEHFEAIMASAWNLDGKRKAKNPSELKNQIIAKTVGDAMLKKEAAKMTRLSYSSNTLVRTEKTT